MKKYAFLGMELLYCFTTQTMDQPEDPAKQLEEFKRHQQAVLSTGSFDKPYDPNDSQARAELIERLRKTLHLRSQGGVNPKNIKSPTTDAALLQAKGSQTPGSTANRDLSNSVLISLVGGIRSSNMTKDPSGAQSLDSTETSISSNSGDATPLACAPDEPTTHMPTLVLSNSAQKDSAKKDSFLGLDDDDPIVAATDATIRTLGFESLLDQLENDELKAQFVQEVNQSPRLLKSASQSPGRKIGVLTPKRYQSPGPNQRTSIDVRSVHSESNSPNSSQSNLKALMEQSSATTAAAAATANHSTTIASSSSRSSSPLVRGLRALRGNDRNSPLRTRRDG